MRAWPSFPPVRAGACPPVGTSVAGMAQKRNPLESALLHQPLIAPAAVHEMATHGGARLGDRAGAQSLEDREVLLLERAQIGDALARRAGGADGLARNDDAAEIFEEACELRVAGRGRDAAVEREV